MTKTFEEKVKSMSAKEIILAMVRGLEKQHVLIDMTSFGSVGYINGCYGCAATNTICEISGKTFNRENIFRRNLRAEFINTYPMFLSSFEAAIDALRCGNLERYNNISKECGFAEIKDVGIVLPILTTEKWQERLFYYKELAEKQD